MARLTHPKTGSVVDIPDEKVERLQVLYGWTLGDGTAPAKKAAATKAVAKKAPAKKAASGKSEE